MRPTGNIDGVQWGKLLLNLNNALNALADLPLRRATRATAVAPVVCRPDGGRTGGDARRGHQAGFADADAGGLDAALLRLPDMIFEADAGRTMKIDPEARSSMWEDLQRGRRTEIDYFQGVITEIAERRGLDVPLSRRIVELIRKAEAAGQGSPGLTPDQIRS